MNVDRVLAIAGRIVRQFMRDHRTVALILIVPSFVMGLLGYLVNQDRATYDVALVNQDEGVTLPAAGGAPVSLRLGDAVARALEADDGLRVTSMSAGEATAALAEGSIAAVFTLPAGLSRDIVAGAGAQLRLELEGSQGTVVQAVTMSAAAALRRSLEYIAEVVGRALPAGRLSTGTPGVPGAPPALTLKPPLELEVTFLHGGPDLDPLDYMAAALIGGFVFFFVFLLTCVSFLRERSSGTMERLAASPLRRGEIVLGYLAGFSIFAVLEALIILFFAIYALKAVFVGSLWLVLLVELMLTLGAVGLGILLSFYARNELQVIQFVPLVIIPQFLLGGLVWPVETLARPLQWLAAVMPLSYAVSALRAVMIKGSGIGDIAVELGFLLGFAVLVAALAAGALRREVA